MAYSIEQRNELPAVGAARRKEVMRRLNDYLPRTGLTVVDFAPRIGYAVSTMRHFVKDRYHRIIGDDRAICSAIEAYMDTHPIDAFTETEGRLHETENVRLIRGCFYAALDERSAYYFRGAPGSQKSFVLQHLIAELNRSEISKNGHGRRAFYVYCPSKIRPTQLMKEVALAAGSICTGDTRRIFRNLRFDIGARKALFVFDEAQHLDVACLETLRELHDMPPRCGLLFAGSHEIEKTFSRLDMEQWHSRLRQGKELPGISEDEAAEIIRAELGDKANIDFLVKKSYATDLRKGREVKYISARTLFRAVKGIQDRKAKNSEVVQ